MAVVEISGGAFWPIPICGASASVYNIGNLAFSAASGKVGLVCQVPKTGNIRKVHFATRTVTSGATVDVRLETVDLTTSPNQPSGTLFGTTTNASQVIANADDNAFFATQLTADAAVTQGDKIAVVISNPAASFGNMQIASMFMDTGFPYSGTNGGASWTFNLQQILTISFEYDDGTVPAIFGVLPPMTANSGFTLTTSANPDVAGLRFSLPFAARVRGAWFVGDTDGDYRIMLISTAYNQGAGTGILATTGTIDATMNRNAAGAFKYVTFTSSYTLTANTVYRLVLEPTTTTSCTLGAQNTNSATLLGAYAGTACTTFAKDPTQDSDWTNRNSGTFTWPAIGLMFDAINLPTAGAPTVGFIGG